MYRFVIWYYKIVQFILSLSILIMFHEFGHFILAKIFNSSVEQLFLFFNPGFSIIKKELGATVYGIGWFPLGGYIKISGIIDEISDKEKKYKSEFACKRLLIILGGVTINTLLSFIIFSGLLFYYGETCLPIKNIKYGFMVNAIGNVLGFKNGDFIRAVDDKEIECIDSLYKDILIAKKISVKRKKKL